MVGAIWRALSKRPQRLRGHDLRPLWLLVGTPSAIRPELAFSRAEHSLPNSDVTIYRIAGNFRRRKFSRFKGRSVWNTFCDFYFRDFKWTDLWISVGINNCGFYFRDSVNSPRNRENKNPAKISRYTVYFFLLFYIYHLCFTCIDFYDLSVWGGCWFVVYIRRFIYKFLNVCPFHYTAVTRSGKVGPVNQVNHTSWVAVVTPTDRPKSVCNRCVIELFCGVVCVVTLPFWHFCWCRGFCHRTESDLFLFLFIKLSFEELYMYFCYESVSTSPHFLCSLKKQGRYLGQFSVEHHALVGVEVYT